MMLTDAQKELCEKLDQPSYTSDDYMVMTEASIEIKYLAERVSALERAAKDQ